MTIREAIARFDAVRPNAMEYAEKIGILSETDGTVKRFAIDTHEGGAEGAFSGYDVSTPGDTELLIGYPYEDVYEAVLEAHADLREGEYDAYGNSLARFSAALRAFCADVNRTRTPKGGRVRFK